MVMSTLAKSSLVSSLFQLSLAWEPILPCRLFRHVAVRRRRVEIRFSLATSVAFDMDYRVRIPDLKGDRRSTQTGDYRHRRSDLLRAAGDYPLGFGALEGMIMAHTLTRFGIGSVGSVTCLGVGACWHWAPVAGHDHIGIGIAIGIAVIAGLTVLGKKGKTRSENDDDAVEEEEAEA